VLLTFVYFLDFNTKDNVRVDHGGDGMFGDKIQAIKTRRSQINDDLLTFATWQEVKSVKPTKARRRAAR